MFVKQNTTGCFFLSPAAWVAATGRIIQNLYSKLEMLCEFRGRGCDVRFPFGNAQEMAEHSAKCPDQDFPEGQEPPPPGGGEEPSTGVGSKKFLF